MADYVESNDGDLVIQLHDHAVGVETHAPTVGLGPADITQAETDAALATCCYSF